MILAIGTVTAGFNLKESIKTYLEKKNKIKVIDLGVYSTERFVRYTDIACKMAYTIQQAKADRGILICGTGMGMALAANKYKCILASCCESIYSARLSRVVNNCNILTLGQFIIGAEMANHIVDAWLEADFCDAPVTNELKGAWREMSEEIYKIGKKAKWI